MIVTLSMSELLSVEVGLVSSIELGDLLAS